MFNNKYYNFVYLASKNILYTHFGFINENSQFKFAYNLDFLINIFKKKYLILLKKINIFNSIN